VRFISFESGGVQGIAIETPNGLYRGWVTSEPRFPGDLHSLLRGGHVALSHAAAELSEGRNINFSNVTLLPPITRPNKIICVGLNYVDHSANTQIERPDYPSLFVRFASCLVGHGKPLWRPKESVQLDYEGELVTVIGAAGRRIPREDALNHVAGYSIFNEASIRDFQKKSTQWTAGKNFDGTGAFGPAFVTADELPQGCKGLRLTTRLNGEIVQDALIDDMYFDVAALVHHVSVFTTLEPGDIIVTGTPPGIGLHQTPPRFLKPGDISEVEIEKIGVLRNPVTDA
jgi:acylpyruvate hydrolase